MLAGPRWSLGYGGGSLHWSHPLPRPVTRPVPPSWSIPPNFHTNPLLPLRCQAQISHAPSAIRLNGASVGCRNMPCSVFCNTFHWHRNHCTSRAPSWICAAMELQNLFLCSRKVCSICKAQHSSSSVMVLISNWTGYCLISFRSFLSSLPLFFHTLCNIIMQIKMKHYV